MPRVRVMNAGQFEQCPIANYRAPVFSIEVWANMTVSDFMRLTNIWAFENLKVVFESSFLLIL